MVKNLLKGTCVSKSSEKPNGAGKGVSLAYLVGFSRLFFWLEELQQAEHLRMLSVYGLQPTKIGDWQCEN